MASPPPPRTPNSPPPAAQRSAWVAGGSGLVGRVLIDVLVEAPEYARVLAITRRPLGREHPRLANRILPFEKLESQLAGTPCQDAFCCLGTTLRRAGSEAAFRAVDHDAVLRFARAARKAGAERFVFVSAVGADPASKNFYLRVKGETEADLAEPRFPVARPRPARPDARRFAPRHPPARDHRPAVHAAGESVPRRQPEGLPGHRRRGAGQGAARAWRDRGGGGCSAIRSRHWPSSPPKARSPAR